MTCDKKDHGTTGGCRVIGSRFAPETARLLPDCSRTALKNTHKKKNGPTAKALAWIIYWAGRIELRAPCFECHWF
ncbi:hypothetical protein GB937_009438 [Aspergillus fischeri]|nr:hypothetical protein GB937_009438 [Aspergillus fischeri]